MLPVLILIVFKSALLAGHTVDAANTQSGNIFAYESVPNTHRQFFRQQLLPTTAKLPVGIQPTQAVSLRLPIKNRSIAMSHWLRVQGKVNGCGKGESAFRNRVWKIEDSLEYCDKANDKYCLSLIGQGEKFERIVNFRLP